MSDFLLRMDEDERAALTRRARAAGLTVQAYVRRQCGIEGDDRMEAFAAAARRAGEKFDSAFASLDAELAARPRANAIALAAGAEEPTRPSTGRAAAA